MINWNKTKIVATLGPASSRRGELRTMLQAGMDVARINGAHGTHKEHRKTIELVRSLSKELGVPTAILIDLPGPKFRIGTLTKEPVFLKKGEVVTLICGKKKQEGENIPVPHNIHRSVKPGHMIFINDGAVALSVIKISGVRIFCRVKSAGEIRSHKGLNLPNTKLDAPSLTAEDKKILDFAIRNKVDYIGLSFVRSAQNIRVLRSILKRRAPHMGIIAKIEKPEALNDLDNIIEASDAIMVARGDLGIELPFYKLPVIQKMILNKCMEAGKPSITATQMLVSMVSAAKPTRAEATDVAGAVWEGSDAVMLSEETSVGKNPAAAVRAMAQIAFETEKEMRTFGSTKDVKDFNVFQAQVLSRAAGFIAQNICAKAIVVPTRSGRTPLFISRDRLPVPVLAPTEDARVARRMNLYWGVRPLTLPTFSTVDELLKSAEKAALKSRLIKKGDTIVIASGAHGRKNDITRLVEVRRV